MCYNPLFVHVGEREDAITGEIKKELRFVNYCDDWDYTLPCCKCAECLMQKSIEWSFRIMLESTKILFHLLFLVFCIHTDGNWSIVQEFNLHICAKFSCANHFANSV